MSNKPANPSEINDRMDRPRVGNHFNKGRRTVEIRWPEPLFKAILAEATLRGWSFSRMVRHLCEASIEGIE